MNGAGQKKTSVQMGVRLLLLVAITVSVGLLAHLIKLDRQQILASSVFIMIVMATLLFWEFRLAIAFVGISVLIGTKTLDLPTFIRECELDIILFLVGMMVTVGVLKELGLFTWIIQNVIKTPRMTGPMFVVIVSILGALMACIVDEVTSIVFVATLIFQVCDTVKIRGNCRTAYDLAAQTGEALYRSRRRVVDTSFLYDVVRRSGRSSAHTRNGGNRRPFPVGLWQSAFGPDAGHYRHFRLRLGFRG
jgi:hypothetical protein